MEFFRRYHKALPDLRGGDLNVTNLTDEEICLTRKCLDLKDNVTLVKMTVPAGDSKCLYVVAPALKAQPYTPPGHTTQVCCIRSAKAEEGVCQRQVASGSARY